MKSSFALFLSSIALCSEHGLGEMKVLREKRHLKSLDETCIASIVDILYEDGTDGQFMTCETPSGKSYKVKNVDKAFIKENFGNGKLVSGNVELSFDLDAMVDESTAEIVSNSLPGFRKKHSKGSKGSKGSRRLGRQLQTQVGNCGTYLGGSCAGTRSVLVVRVIADDKSTTASESQLAESIFENPNDSLNLQSWYKQCSYNQLDFEPATGTGINGGVTTVTVPSKSTDGDSKMNNDIVEALNAKFSVSSPNQIANHVMYCLPAGTMSGIAYANINNWRSVYSDNWCTYVSAQAHEIGHNLALAHSGDPAATGSSATYGDQSGMMGFSYSQDNGPIQCFNAPKNWQLGWYDDKQISVSFEGWQGNLIGLSEIPSAAADDMVIAKADLNESYYVSFNRKAGINSGTTEGGNQVLVHKRDLGTGYAESDILAYLNSGGSYTSPDTNFKVTVNSINLTSNPARANVKIERLDNPPPCYTGTVSVSITPDSYVGETSWDIRDDAENVFASGGSTGLSNIVLADGFYTFSIYDSFGDGICCAYGNGSYTFQVGSTVVKTGGEFGSQESTQFGICSNVSPTVPPTNPPSPAPTSSPSSSPTSSPSTAPTKSPTPNPTVPPTLAPTEAPTTAPTSSPTAAPVPTASPTATPTQSPTIPPPTSSPTSSPTTAPTKSPTPNPTNVPTSAPTAPCYDGSVTVSITLDNYPAETSWEIKNEADNVVAQGDSESGSTGQANINLADGYYKLTIYDSYGDGLCCGYGIGSYTLEVGSTVIKTGGEFGFQEVTEFGICSYVSPTQAPTIPPTAAPTSSPTSSPTESPSEVPSMSSDAPSSSPFASPSSSPSFSSDKPSIAPTSNPSAVPSMSTNTPSSSPFASPSYFPSEKPSLLHSLLPSIAPTEKISNLPSLDPSAQPSKNQIMPSPLPSLSIAPTKYRSDRPSWLPSENPSVGSSVSPSNAPIQIFVDQSGVEYGGSAELVNCAGTNTNMIRRFHDTGYVTFTVGLECTDVDVEVSYLSGANRTMHIFVNSESSQIFDSSETGAWCNAGGTSSTKVLAGLSGFQEGLNTLTFQNPAGASSPLLEWIKFKGNCLSSPFVSPSAAPSMSSDKPSSSPLSSPSATPSMSSDAPSASPFASPSAAPSMSSDAPSASPFASPSATPSMSSDAPSASPFASPSAAPSMSSDAPSASPFASPSAAPSMSSDKPSSSPSYQPTSAPTNAPTSSPTSAPTNSPTFAPTSSLTSAPTNAPTVAVTSSPSLSQGCDTVEVIIVMDNYPAETSWQLTDATSTVVLSGSGYTTSGDTISEEVCVDDWTSLSFTINDSYGDGICCSYGSGSYTVNVNGNTVLSGGSFGSSETKPLQPEPCDHGEDFIDGKLVCKCGPGEKRIAVDLRTDRYPSETSWAIKTCAGDVVATGSYTQTETDHTDYICVESSSPYQFQISDSYGDGICCSYGEGNYQLSFDGTVQVSGDGSYGSGEVKDLNGVCPASSIEASDSLIEASDTTLECSSVTRKRKCTGNCEWVREDMKERGLKKGKRRRRGVCKPKEKEEPKKEEPKKEEPSVPKCAACASTGAACCGTCVNSGPAFMRGCS